MFFKHCGKSENPGTKYFPLFPQCFLPCTSLRFCCLVKRDLFFSHVHKVLKVSFCNHAVSVMCLLSCNFHHVTCVQPGGHIIA